MPVRRLNHRLFRSFFRKKVAEVAVNLIGQRLVRVIHGRRLAGIIVETEAYLGIPDQAAHTFNGRHTKRNHSMWMDGGHAYIYSIYGMHHCLNMVAGCEGEPVAVLLRAIEPTEGLDRMRKLRGQAARQETDLCSGPAKLCQALDVDRRFDGIDTTQNSSLWVERIRARPYVGSKIIATTRVGVDYAGPWAHKLLRFYLVNNPHISCR